MKLHFIFYTIAGKQVKNYKYLLSIFKTYKYPPNCSKLYTNLPLLTFNQNCFQNSLFNLSTTKLLERKKK